MTHAHHWLLESPGGPTVQGTCKTCGAVKEFQAWDESWGWNDGGEMARRKQRKRLKDRGMPKGLGAW